MQPYLSIEGGFSIYIAKVVIMAVDTTNAVPKTI
jgi:hypothetical protein